VNCQRDSLSPASTFPDLIVDRLRKSGRGVLAGLIKDQILKGRAPGGPWGQVVQVPQLGDEAEDAGVGVDTSVVAAVGLDGALGEPVGHEDGWDTDAQAGEIEGVGFPVNRLLGVCEGVAGRDVGWWHDVVGEASVLVEGHDEEGVFPLWAVAEGLVDPLDELLAVVHGGWRVE